MTSGPDLTPAPRAAATPRAARPGRTLVGRWRDERGQVSGWAVITTVTILLLAGLLLDGGLAMAARVRAGDTAQAAARAGARELDLTAYRATGEVRLDPDRAAAAARAFLAATGATGTATATAATVTVTVTGRQPTRLLQLIGVRSIPVAATAQAAPVTGVTGPGT